MTQDRFPMTIGGEEVLNEHHCSPTQRTAR